MIEQVRQRPLYCVDATDRNKIVGFRRKVESFVNMAGDRGNPNIRIDVDRYSFDEAIPGWCVTRRWKIARGPKKGRGTPQG